MKIVTVTHANIKEGPDKLAKVFADLDMISFWYYSEAQKATILIAPGAALPVLESPEVIKNLKQGEPVNESNRKQRRR